MLRLACLGKAGGRLGLTWRQLAIIACFAALAWSSVVLLWSSAWLGTPLERCHVCTPATHRSFLYVSILT